MRLKEFHFIFLSTVNVRHRSARFCCWSPDPILFPVSIFVLGCSFFFCTYQNEREKMQRARCLRYGCFFGSFIFIFFLFLGTCFASFGAGARAPHCTHSALSVAKANQRSTDQWGGFNVHSFCCLVKFLLHLDSLVRVLLECYCLSASRRCRCSFDDFFFLCHLLKYFLFHTLSGCLGYRMPSTRMDLLSVSLAGWY